MIYNRDRLKRNSSTPLYHFLNTFYLIVLNSSRSTWTKRRIRNQTCYKCLLVCDRKVNPFLERPLVISSRRDGSNTFCAFLPFRRNYDRTRLSSTIVAALSGECRASLSKRGLSLNHVNTAINKGRTRTMSARAGHYKISRTHLLLLCGCTKKESRRTCTKCIHPPDSRIHEVVILECYFGIHALCVVRTSLKSSETHSRRILKLGTWKWSNYDYKTFFFLAKPIRSSMQLWQRLKNTDIELLVTRYHLIKLTIHKNLRNERSESPVTKINNLDA